MDLAADTHVPMTHVEIVPGDDGHVLVSVISDQGRRRPVDVVAVVDVSGSMGESADNPTLNVETTGLRIIDVVRHALRAVTQTLTAEDSFALVTYSDTAKVALDF